MSGALPSRHTRQETPPTLSFVCRDIIPGKIAIAFAILRNTLTNIAIGKGSISQYPQKCHLVGDIISLSLTYT